MGEKMQLLVEQISLFGNSEVKTEVSSHPALEWCSWKSCGGGKPISFTRFPKSSLIQDSELCDYMIRVQVYVAFASYAAY